MRAASFTAVVAFCLWAEPLLAQDDNGTVVTVPQGGGTTVVLQPSTTTTTTTVPPPGYPAPGTDPNAGLPASSRPTTDTSRSTDGFDLYRGSSGGGTVRGSKGAAGILEGGQVGPGSVPNIHTVRRGDTLWDLCGYYYRNPYQWPKVWSYNPQIQNPHWIYPGDQVRMRSVDSSMGAGLGRPGGAAGSSLAEGSLGRYGRAGVGGAGGAAGSPQRTVYLRDQGYLGDPDRDTWGELVGAREDQMLLSAGNHVYLQIRPGKQVQVGQELTLFRPLRAPDKVAGSRKPPGQIVAVKGTVRVDEWDPDKRVARGQIVESSDAIERGAKVGPLDRKFDVVPPKVNSNELWARVLTSIYPLVFMAQNQVVFIDKGSEDGLAAGNRLFVVRRGDTWRRSLRTSTHFARERMKMDDPEPARSEATPLKGNEKNFPDEIIGELRILRTEKYSSVALVTVSHQEILAGDRAVAKKGY